MTSFKKFGSLLLLFCTVSAALAQTQSYKSLTEDLQALQKQLVPDKRIAILDIELKDTLQPVVIIRGETNLLNAKLQIIGFLNEKKISFVDSVRLLPDVSPGERTWALATLSVSNLRLKPNDTSELVSQALMGTPMKVLDIKGGWLRVQTPDYYIGWMDAGELTQLTMEELNRWKNSNRWLFNTITGIISASPKKRAEVVSDVVLGNLFEVEKKVKGYLKIRLPDGRNGYIRKKQCLSFNEWSQFEPSAEKVISVAVKMTGFPYLWGGTSTKAVDCSGLVKLAYYSQGIILARDASQQALHGEPLDFTRLDNLQPGDLLFFGRSPQRITHVGIYIKKGDFINSSGKVHVSSIFTGDPKFNPKRNYVAACRVLNALNTEGIVMVKDHPWYK